MIHSSTQSARQSLLRASDLGWVYGAFLLSGTAALVYEIAWSRQIGLILGQTAQAGAVVLAAYFLGLTLGNAVGARFAPRLKRPLRAYALAELSAAAWVLITPTLVGLLEHPLATGLIHHPNTTVRLVIRIGVSLALLLPATCALGLTLPWISELVSQRNTKHTRHATVAYTLNTVGAVVGVLAATFALLPWLGVSTSSVVAAGLALLAGTVALRLDRRLDSSTPTQVAEQGSSSVPLRLFGLACLSGFGSLALQVIYTRLFALTLHNSTYSFGVIVAVFLIALAIGAAVVAKVTLRSSLEPMQLLGWLCLLGAGAIVLSLGVFRGLTGLQPLTGGGIILYFAKVLGLGLVVVGPPMVLLGMVLPLTWQSLAGGSPGSIVGRLVSANTLAAAAGALLAELFLLRHAGLWLSACIVSGGYAIVGLAIVMRQRAKAFGPAHAMGLATLAVALLVFTGLAGRIHTDPPADYTHVRTWRTSYGLVELLQQKESDGLMIRQDHHQVVGTSVRTESALRRGHIPLLLHPKPKDVLFLGLGDGVTPSAALRSDDVEKVSVVEIVPEIVEAASYFGPFNEDITAHPKAQVHVDDARTYLKRTDERFDVIVSDLLVPWHSQSGYLYTVEHYRAAARKLKPGGVFCQWLPLYHLGPHEMGLIANSFAAEFNHVTLWRGALSSDEPVLALVGSDRSTTLDGQVLASRLPAVTSADGSKLKHLSTPEDLFSLYVGDWPLRGPKRLNTDDHPRLEFLAPLTQTRSSYLVGPRLRAFYDHVLDTLPTINAVLRSQNGERWLPRTGRSTQRALLDELRRSEAPRSK